MEYQHKFSNAPFSTRKGIRRPLIWISISTSTILIIFFFYSLGGHTIREPLQSYLCPSPFSVETTFRRYDEFHDISSTGDNHWDTLITPNGGFVVLDPPSDQTYGIAMFHQLHCLQMIRSTMKSLMNQSISADGEIGHSAHHEAENHEGGSSHAMHCFDYLSQSILCFADGSLEKPVERTKEGFIINGYGPHKCRNKDELYKVSLDTGLLSV